MPSLPSVRRCCGRLCNLRTDGKNGAGKPLLQQPQTARRLKNACGPLFVETKNCLKENTALVENYLGKSISI